MSLIVVSFLVLASLAVILGALTLVEDEKRVEAFRECVKVHEVNCLR